MSAKVSVSSNIDSVIASVDDVADDLHREIRKRVGSAMRVVLADAKQYVQQDPDFTGDLLRSLGFEEDAGRTSIEFSVAADGGIAPYAAIVEYGSGSRTNVSFEDAPQMPPPEDPPPDYPFESPDISNISGFAYFIEQWMRRKGITPKYDSYRASALAIAKTINDRGNYAHPFLRPAWFDNELMVKKAAKNAIRNAVR